MATSDAMMAGTSAAGAPLPSSSVTIDTSIATAADYISKASPASPAPSASAVGQPAARSQAQPQPQPQPPTSSALARSAPTPSGAKPAGPASTISPAATVATPPVSAQTTGTAPLAAQTQGAAAALPSSGTAVIPSPSPPSLNSGPVGGATVFPAPAAPAGSSMPPSSASPPASLPLAALGSNKSASDAQRFGLGHLQNIGPGSSYSSPLQAFRPPTHVSQPLSSRASTAPRQTPQAPAGPQNAPQQSFDKPSSSSVSKPSPPLASVAVTQKASTQKASPPTASKQNPGPSSRQASSTPTGTAAATSAQSADIPSSSNYAASDAARAIPTNKNNPAFLNKLRSMVDDPQTDELIRWSPDGASFFVPNHVRFGDEVLPRFFKHNRFSSFVRQLNMYGFHKVPHLQQGALKHDSPTESELWEFSNPNFHRDHPDWLARVQRKKGVRDNGEADKEKEKEPMSNELTHPASLIKGLDLGIGAAAADGDQGALQLTSVLNAINAITTAQNSITTDLRHLQNSNQSLWQEAIESRKRAKRQQETINKILRFLAGVFGAQDGEDGGNNAAAVSTSKDRGGHGVGVRPVRQDRLMIEDGRGRSTTANGGSNFYGLPLEAEEEEIEEMPAAMRFTTEDSPQGNSPPQDSSPQGNSSSRFTALGSPPRKAANLPDLQPETISTPGDSRRLSSQAGSSILNALASGEGSAWLTNLFGGNTANQGTANSAASTPGGSFKLDTQMVAALQQAIASGTSASDQDYFAGSSGGSESGKDARPDSKDSRFSYAAPLARPAAVSRVSSKGKAQTSGSSNGSSAGMAKAAAQAKGQPNGLDHDTLSKIAGLSQALVHSPSRTHAKVARSHSNSNLHLAAHANDASDSFFDAVADPDNQQVGMPLSRVSRDIQGTASDVDQVQNSIKSLVESLKLDPSILKSLAGNSGSGVVGNGSGNPAYNSDNNNSSNKAPANPAPAYGSGGSGSNHASANTSASSVDSGNAKAWANPAGATSAVEQAFHGLALPDASQPPSAFASSAVHTSLPSTANPSSTAAGITSGNSLGIDADFDVDSFLDQFVDASQAPGQSPAAFHHAGSPTSGIGGGGGDASTIFGSGLGLGGMMDDDAHIGTSPSFAFSPGTTAAFLQGDPSSDIGGAGGGGGGEADLFGSGGDGGSTLQTVSSQTNSTASSAHSTPVVGSWGIEHPAPSSIYATAGSGGHTTPMSVSTPPPNQSHNVSPAISLSGSGTGTGSSLKKRKTTTVESANETGDLEMESTSRSGNKKTRKSQSPKRAAQS